MNNNEIAVLELAKSIEFNLKAEAQAVLDYTEMLKQNEMLDIEKEDKEFIKDTINEIVADELNHQEKLKMLYTMLTGIKANKN